MHITGIICEYNPMHSGHAYQLRYVRETGTDCTVLVMSGPFTERGEVAVLGKYERAEIAVRMGADLVLELPYPYAASGAEYFAKAGVRILESIGASAICFGSETGDLALLRRAAEVASSAEFAEAFSETGRSGVGSAAAYFGLLNRFLGTESFGANDVLGVEYLKAMRSVGSRMEPLVLLRHGANYHDTALSEAGHPSATALRAALFSADTYTAAADIYERESGLPKEATLPFRRAIEVGTAPMRFEHATDMILGYYRMQSPETLCGVAEMHGGLAERILNAANEATDLSAFYRLASTKKYTDSRVRRAILYGMTGVSVSDLQSTPAYVNLLGASERGRACLSMLRKRKEQTVRIVTRPAAVLELSGGGASDGQNAGRDESRCSRQVELQLRAEALYAMLAPSPLPARAHLLRRPFVE